MSESGWESWESWARAERETPVRHFKLTLTDCDIQNLDREQLEMIQDGLWLIEQAFKGNVRGPLNTPRLGIPVRT